MQITAVMSVYNGKKYLHDSIPSILNQSSPDWRLICIDDGSTDESLSILREYEKQDSRIMVIHQENHGLAYGRAHAFEYAETEFVAILDCDDAWSPNYVETMIKRIEETGADAVVSDVEFGYMGQKYDNFFKEKNTDTDEVIEGGENAFSRTIPWTIHGWFCMKRELVQKYYTREAASASPAKGFYDEFLARMMYYYCEKVVFCKDALYLYRMDEGSITRSVSIHKLDALDSLTSLMQFAIDKQVNHNVRVRILNELYINLVNLWGLIGKMPVSQQNEAREKVMTIYKTKFCSFITIENIKSAPIKTAVKLLLAKLNWKFVEGISIKNMLKQAYWGGAETV